MVVKALFFLSALVCLTNACINSNRGSPPNDVSPNTLASGSLTKYHRCVVPGGNATCRFSSCSAGEIKRGPDYDDETLCQTTQLTYMVCYQMDGSLGSFGSCLEDTMECDAALKDGLTSECLYKNSRFIRCINQNAKSYKCRPEAAGCRDVEIQSPNADQAKTINPGDYPIFRAVASSLDQCEAMNPWVRCSLRPIVSLMGPPIGNSWCNEDFIGCPLVADRLPSQGLYPSEEICENINDISTIRCYDSSVDDYFCTEQEIGKPSRCVGEGRTTDGVIYQGFQACYADVIGFYPCFNPVTGSFTCSAGPCDGPTSDGPYPSATSCLVAQRDWHQFFECGRRVCVPAGFPSIGIKGQPAVNYHTRDECLTKTTYSLYWNMFNQIQCYPFGIGTYSEMPVGIHTETLAECVNYEFNAWFKCDDDEENLMCTPKEVGCGGFKVFEQEYSSKRECEDAPVYRKCYSAISDSLRCAADRCQNDEQSVHFDDFRAAFHTLDECEAYTPRYDQCYTPDLSSFICRPVHCFDSEVFSNYYSNKIDCEASTYFHCFDNINYTITDRNICQDGSCPPNTSPLYIPNLFPRVFTFDSRSDCLANEPRHLQCNSTCIPVGTSPGEPGCPSGYVQESIIFLTKGLCLEDLTD